MSIKEAAELVIEGMDFKGPVVVSLLYSSSHCDIIIIIMAEMAVVLKRGWLPH